MSIWRPAVTKDNDIPIRKPRFAKYLVLVHAADTSVKTPELRTVLGTLSMNSIWAVAK